MIITKHLFYLSFKRNSETLYLGVVLQTIFWSLYNVCECYESMKSNINSVYILILRKFVKWILEIAKLINTSGMGLCPPDVDIDSSITWRFRQSRYIYNIYILNYIQYIYFIILLRLQWEGSLLITCGLMNKYLQLSVSLQIYFCQSKDSGSSTGCYPTVSLYTDVLRADESRGIMFPGISINYITLLVSGCSVSAKVCW